MFGTKYDDYIAWQRFFFIYEKMQVNE